MSYTRGPWKWRINKCTKRIYLVGRGLTVMDFVRYGMSCAAPRFLAKDHLMVRADELATVIPGEAHHASWNQDIDHPDARLIASAPELLEALKWVADQPYWQGGKFGDIVLIQHAIAKATGGSE